MSEDFTEYPIQLLADAFLKGCLGHLESMAQILFTPFSITFQPLRAQPLQSNADP